MTHLQMIEYLMHNLNSQTAIQDSEKGRDMNNLKVKFEIIVLSYIVQNCGKKNYC